MSYSKLTTAYKIDRMRDMFRILDSGKALDINGLFLEEIKFLKSLYGKELRKEGSIIYRVMEEEVLF